MFKFLSDAIGWKSPQQQKVYEKFNHTISETLNYLRYGVVCYIGC